MEKILFVPHPKLCQHAQTIDKVTEKKIIISKKMIEIMKKASGAGLAANQIGILKKIVAVNIQDQEKKKKKYMRCLILASNHILQKQWRWKKDVYLFLNNLLK